MQWDSREFVIPGEPMIFSMKYMIGDRHLTSDVFRNQAFFSILKSSLPAYTKPDTPLSLEITFFVSPPNNQDIDPKACKSDKVHAVRSFELCDYLLSFQEMLMSCLIKTYKQFCHISAKKFYSNNPRTSFRIAPYARYKRSKNFDSMAAQAKKFCTLLERKSLLSEFKRDVENKRKRKVADNWSVGDTVYLPYPCDCSLQNTGAPKPKAKRKKKVARKAPRKKTGRGQSGQVFV